MHPGEHPIDTRLVRRLVAAQFPAWSELDVRRVSSNGTVNAVYRLGSELVARLPRTAHWGILEIDREFAWLAEIAAAVGVDVPEPVGRGRPGFGYPWPWAVHTWLDGKVLDPGLLDDDTLMAEDLAELVLALRSMDPGGAPPARRGQPAAAMEAPTRMAVAELADQHDIGPIIELLERAWAAPVWSGQPVWLHGDLMPGNLLVRRGRLAGVIDWGEMGVGDPAGDLIVAWFALSAPGRAVFREALGTNEATWSRGRGLAVAIAVQGASYYRNTNVVFAQQAMRAIDAAVNDMSG